MASRPIGSGTVSFGLVSISVKLFSAARSKPISFNLLHNKCLGRIQQKVYCPTDDAYVERTDLLRGYEIEKGKYVTFSDDELKELEAEGDHAIKITEFVPLSQVDPMYFESSYFLAVDKGASKAYRLLTDAMAKSQRVALGSYTMRGKENLVLIRPYAKGLLLHTLYYADEVKTIDEFDRAENEAVVDAEMDMATRLIDSMTKPTFDPSAYHDSYRERVIAAAQKKSAGETLATVTPAPKQSSVGDLMALMAASMQTGKAVAGTPYDPNKNGKAPTPTPVNGTAPKKDKKKGGSKPSVRA